MYTDYDYPSTGNSQSTRDQFNLTRDQFHVARDLSSSCSNTLIYDGSGYRNSSTSDRLAPPESDSTTSQLYHTSPIHFSSPGNQPNYHTYDKNFNYSTIHSGHDQYPNNCWTDDSDRTYKRYDPKELDVTPVYKHGPSRCQPNKRFKGPSRRDESNSMCTEHRSSQYLNSSRNESNRSKGNIFRHDNPKTSRASTGNTLTTRHTSMGRAPNASKVSTGLGLKTSKVSTGHGLKTSKPSTGLGLRTSKVSTGHGLKTSKGSMGHAVKTSKASIGDGLKTPRTSMGHDRRTSFNSKVQLRTTSIRSVRFKRRLSNTIDDLPLGADVSGRERERERVRKHKRRLCVVCICVCD